MVDRTPRFSRSRTSWSPGQSGTESLGNHMRQSPSSTLHSCFRLNNNNDLWDMLLLEAQLTAVKAVAVAVDEYKMAWSAVLELAARHLPR